MRLKFGGKRMKSFQRKHLCVPGLLQRVKSQFCRIQDSLVNSKFNLTDCLMSGVALFGLKYPSLLSFEKDIQNNLRIQHNLSTLYGVKNVPSDTYFRERLDDVSQKGLQKGIDRIIAQLQR